MKNKHILGLMMGAILLMLSAGSCADTGFKSVNDFGEWMTFFYQNPSFDRVPSALAYFCDSPMYGSNATMPTVAFFSALFMKDASLMQKTFDEISSNGTEDAKIMLVNVLSLTNTPESKELLEKAKSLWESETLQRVIDGRLARPHDDLYAISVDGSQVLDMLWASFSATGDALPIQRIISVLHLQEDGHGEEIIIGGAANWSLKSNAQQHPRVLEICKSEFAGAEGITKEMLGEIINQ